MSNITPHFDMSVFTGIKLNPYYQTVSLIVYVTVRANKATHETVKGKTHEFIVNSWYSHYKGSFY